MLEIILSLVCGAVSYYFFWLRVSHSLLLPSLQYLSSSLLLLYLASLCIPFFLSFPLVVSLTMRFSPFSAIRTLSPDPRASGRLTARPTTHRTCATHHQHSPMYSRWRACWLRVHASRLLPFVGYGRLGRGLLLFSSPLFFRASYLFASYFGHFLTLWPAVQRL